MNYQKHYNLLIQRAQSRSKPEGYTEKHHIVPRCMGGGNEKENIAVLTAREHFVVHLMLVKIHPRVSGLACAAYRLATSAKHNSWRYAWLRARKALDTSRRCKGRVGTMLGKHHSAETKRKQSAAQKGKPRPELIGRVCSPATRAKLSASNKGQAPSMLGRSHSEETKLKMSLTKKGKTSLLKGRPRTEETKAKISAATSGKVRSAEARANISAGKKGKPLSAEHRAKISEAGKGRVTSPETRARLSLARIASWAARRTDGNNWGEAK